MNTVMESPTDARATDSKTKSTFLAIAWSKVSKSSGLANTILEASIAREAVYNSYEDMGGGLRLAVVGAGVAGLSCAYWASKAGHDVVVYERNRELGLKPCGEGVPEDALRHLPPGCRCFILNKVTRCLLCLHWEPIQRIDATSTFGYIIDKKAMLRELKEAAESEGAVVRMGRSVKPWSKLEYDLIVDASGNPGSIARWRGLNYHGYRSIPALQCYCKGRLSEDEILISILPFGYGWAFPRGDGSVNFGVGGFSSVRNLESWLKVGLRRLRLELGSSIRAAPVCVSGPIRKLSAKGVVAAGEAAGLVMPSSGEGIKYALFSGRICFTRRYEKLWREAFGRRFQIGKTVLKMTVAIPEKLRSRAVAEAGDKLVAQLYLAGRIPLLEAIGALGISLLRSV